MINSLNYKQYSKLLQYIFVKVDWLHKKIPAIFKTILLCNYVGEGIIH
jgi:hypothetical protein